MKSLYITSVERYSGKTATCLALGMRFKADGYQVGYLKPLSLQPWRQGNRLMDEDAVFVKEILDLIAEPWELSPVVITPELLREVLAQPRTDLLRQVQNAYQNAGMGKDILLLEGGGSLREGYVVGLPTPVVASTLDCQVLVVVKYREEVRLMDDILAAQTRLGDRMCGIIINQVPADKQEFVTKSAQPFIEGRGIRIYGILPEMRSLSALTVGELVQLLEAEVLTKFKKLDALVENLTVGAMTADAALSRFRRYSNKAVITGGDRTDIQLAALETSTTCLILTGNLRPSPLVIRQAEEFGVTTLLVRLNTMETIEAIERVFGKTRLGQATKLKQFQTLLDRQFDFTSLYRDLNLNLQ
jgi:hypothetical protein